MSLEFIGFRSKFGNGIARPDHVVFRFNLIDDISFRDKRISVIAQKLAIYIFRNEKNSYICKIYSVSEPNLVSCERMDSPLSKPNLVPCERMDYDRFIADNYSNAIILNDLQLKGFIDDCGFYVSDKLTYQTNC